MQKLLSARLAILLATALVAVGAADARGTGSVSVRGYFRSNGTYVAPHFRSAPDGSFANNWSTKGNFNPYTGAEGTRLSPPYRPGSGLPSYTPSPAPSQYQYRATPDAPAVVYSPRRKSTYVQNIDATQVPHETTPDSLILETQVALRTRGFLGTPPSDELDTETRQALMSFQRAMNLPSHGRMDRATLSALGISISDLQ